MTIVCLAQPTLPSRFTANVPNASNQSVVRRWVSLVGEPELRQVHTWFVVDTGIVQCPACGVKNRTPVATVGKPRCAKCQTDLPWLVPADDSTIAGALDASPVVLLDLWAPWCGPCRMVAPILDQLSVEYAGRLKVVQVNVDDSPATSAKFEARSIPTLVVLDRGQVVERIIGAQPKPVLAAAIDKALAAR